MDELLTVAQVAELLKTNKNLVYSLQKEGILRGLKLGSLKFRARTVEEFLERFDGYDLTDLKQIKALNGGIENETPKANKVRNLDGVTFRHGF